MTYPSDMNDKQWALIKDHFDTGNYGKSLKYSKRELTNAVFYVIKTGCQWRFLPKEYPPWKTVYGTVNKIDFMLIFSFYKKGSP